MNVQKTLKNCLLSYPMIFENKWAVYHHWFIVNGNGYEWVNGELTDSYELVDDELKPVQEEEFSIEDSIEIILKRGVTEKDTTSDRLGHTIKRMKEELVLVLDWENRSKDFTPKEDLYPLCKYAKILNIPKNIKEDWLDAIKEFYRFLLDSKETLSENNKAYLDKIAISLKENCHCTYSKSWNQPYPRICVICGKPEKV